MNDLSNLIERNEIYNHYKKYFDLNVGFIELANFFVDRINEKKLKDTEFSDFQRVVASIACKAMRLFAGIHVLSNKGHAIEAAILVRSLLEDLIDLKFIDQDREKRATLFINYLKIDRKRVNDIVKKHHLEALIGDFLENEEVILSEYEKVKDLFTGKNWCGKSIKQRAQAIGFEKQYDIVYSYLSILHHPSFAGMLVHIKHGDRKVLFDVGPNEQLLTLVLPASYGYFVDFLEYFREAFALGGEKEIQELSRRIKELIK